IWNIAVPVFTLISYLSPFIVTHPYLIEKASFHFNTKIDGYVAMSDSDFTIMYSQLYVFMSVFVVASSCVSVVSMTCLCQRTKRIKFPRAERSMLTLALLNFLIEASYFIILTIIRIDVTGNFEKNARYTLIPFASDLMTFSTPYLIVVLNKSVRKRLLRPFECRTAVLPVQALKISSRFRGLPTSSSQ
ncbi:hypothetical protein GCK32_012780, partial [Trichostrongylus colubriformis]